MVRVGVFNKPALKEVARLYDSLILEALRYQQVEVTSHKVRLNPPLTTCICAATKPRAATQANTPLNLTDA